MSFRYPVYIFYKLQITDLCIRYFLYSVVVNIAHFFFEVLLCNRWYPDY